MTWFGEGRIETASGLIYDYQDPDPESITLDDIAHGLANNCRFGGHTKYFYSVAQHSVLVGRILEAWGEHAEVVRAGFMHDGHETYLIDLPKPLKRQLGPEYDQLTKLADDAIAQRFGLVRELLEEPVVKRADTVALVHEAKLLLPSGGWPDWEEDLPEGVTVPDRPTLYSGGWNGPKEFFLDFAKVWGVEEVRSSV